MTQLRQHNRRVFAFSGMVEPVRQEHVSPSFRSLVAFESALPAKQPWMDDAACHAGGVDPDLFFPDPGDDLAAPLAVCADCVVREDCLSWVMAEEEAMGSTFHGIWGGLTVRKRRAAHRAAAAVVVVDLADEVEQSPAAAAEAAPPAAA